MQYRSSYRAASTPTMTEVQLRDVVTDLATCKQSFVQHQGMRDALKVYSGGSSIQRAVAKDLTALQSIGGPSVGVKHLLVVALEDEASVRYIWFQVCGEYVQPTPNRYAPYPRRPTTFKWWLLAVEANDDNCTTSKLDKKVSGDGQHASLLQHILVGERGGGESDVVKALRAACAGEPHMVAR